MSECQRKLRAEGKPYPRTCGLCGLWNPCRLYPAEADNSVNQYRPWESQGITELRYWKDRYLEARRESKQATDALTELLPSSAGERIVELEDAVRELTAEIARLRKANDFMNEQAMRVNNGWD